MDIQKKKAEIPSSYSNGAMTSKISKEIGERQHNVARTEALLFQIIVSHNVI